MNRFRRGDPLIELEPVCQPEDVSRMQAACREILVSEAVLEYIADLVQASRGCVSFRYGASPRGSLGLMRAAQGLAALSGRDYVIPDDVKRMVLPTLGHRVILTDKERLCGSESCSFLQDIMESMPVPDSQARTAT